MGEISPAYPQICTRILWISDRLNSRNVLQRQQSVARPRPRAGIVAGIELAARRWPGSVNRAGNTDADFSGKRCAARWRSIRAAHAQKLRGHRHRQFARHPRRPGKGAAGQFSRMKIDAEGGTAGAASGAGVSHPDSPHSDRATGRSRGTCARRATPARQE
ncbi:MAG: hypothetical protein QG584_1202 [Pseudomonadota bacterium]|nr:hypothetical protein [Pseudomonadota bacterium]